jgi:hypothetical protein
MHCGQAFFGLPAWAQTPTPGTTVTPPQADDDDDGSGGEWQDGEGDPCPLCGHQYQQDEFWIACDDCDRWFCGRCTKVRGEGGGGVKWGSGGRDPEPRVGPYLAPRPAGRAWKPRVWGGRGPPPQAASTMPCGEPAGLRYRLWLQPRRAQRPRPPRPACLPSQMTAAKAEKMGCVGLGGWEGCVLLAGQGALCSAPARCRRRQDRTPPGTVSPQCAEPPPLPLLLLAMLRRKWFCGACPVR